MKLILRQYLEGLRERDELDAILPALLSELGFHVLSRPGRGTRQAGVDVAAIGPDEWDGNKQKLFLFVIKSGDLTRNEWDGGSPQAVRQSINEILDSYIPTRIPPEYRSLGIAICLCMGGETKEAVATQWANYQARNSCENLCFREWNGDKLANLLLTGLLKQELLPQKMRAAFQKSVAMIDEPDISHKFFKQLAENLINHDDSDRQKLTRLRQLYVCLWVLYVWAREADNLEAPFRASETALLRAWDTYRHLIGMNNTYSEFCCAVLGQTLHLHMTISHHLLHKKIGNYAHKDFALSIGVNSISAIDVNLALYEALGRTCLFGIWQHWIARSKVSDEERVEAVISRNRSMDIAFGMINTNPSLFSPIRDDFAIEITLFMILACACGCVHNASKFLTEMAHRLIFSIKTRQYYPITSHNYHDLIENRGNNSRECLEDNTNASILYPLLVFWINDEEEVKHQFIKTIQKDLAHCTQQVWLPDGETDNLIWSGNTEHGIAIPGLDLSSPADSDTDLLQKACDDHPDINEISAIRIGFSPIFLLACRHYRMPIPPQFWTWTGEEFWSDEEE